MKRFICKVLVFLLVIALITIPVEIYKIHHASVYAERINGGEVYTAINKSQTKKVVKRLVLGDSVGHQLYPCEQYYDSIVSLACNKAITLAGQFFLLKNFVEINIDDLPEEIILLITPFSLSNDVDKYAYQYFLKPFPPSNYSKFYTEHLFQRIHSIPMYWTANIPFIQTSNYTPQWAVVPFQQEPKSISQLSYEYLLKIDSVANTNNIKFRMLSTPVRDDRQCDVATFWENLPAEYMSKLPKLLQSYKESIVYLPHEWYYDAVHFGEGKIPNDYLNLLSD